MTKKDNANTFGMAITDTTLEPRYFEGDLLIIDPDAEMKSGDYCIFKNNNLYLSALIYEGRDKDFYYFKDFSAPPTKLSVPIESKTKKIIGRVLMLEPGYFFKKDFE